MGGHLRGRARVGNLKYRIQDSREKKVVSQHFFFSKIYFVKIAAGVG